MRKKGRPPRHAGGEGKQLPVPPTLREVNSKIEDKLRGGNKKPVFLLCVCEIGEEKASAKGRMGNGSGRPIGRELGGQLRDAPHLPSFVEERPMNLKAHNKVPLSFPVQEKMPEQRRRAEWHI